MATVQRYVNTASAGGDGTTNNLSGATAAYASLSAWQAAAVGNVANDFIVDCAGTAADTTAVTVSFTCNSVIIRGNRSDPAGFYTGNLTQSASFYRLVVSSANTVLALSTKNVTVDGIQVELANSGATFNGIEFPAATGDTVVKNCRVIRTAGTNQGVGIGTSAGLTGGANGYTFTIENNLVVAFDDNIRLRCPDFWTRTATIRDNTCYGGGTTNALTISDSASAACTYTIKGNAVGNTGAVASIAVALGSSSTATYEDNACSVASSTTNEIVLGTAANAWTSPGSTTSSDFSVKDTSSSLYNAVNPTLTTTDITGFTRDGTNHDVGAFELQQPISTGSIRRMLMSIG